MPFWTHSPGSHRHRNVGHILHCLRRICRSADCHDLHVRRVRRVRRICWRLVHLAGGGNRGCRDYCRRRRCCDDTSNYRRIVCARKVAREPFLLATVFARRRGYRRRVGMCLVSTAPLAVVATDFYVALTLIALDNCHPRSAFLHLPIATQLPFC